MDLNNRLANKVAIVTGGNVGIGRATSLRLAAEGADVVITSRTLASLKSFQAEIETLGRKALPLELDVRNYDSIQKMVAAA